jgi:hypothetical protein
MNIPYCGSLHYILVGACLHVLQQAQCMTITDDVGFIQSLRSMFRRAGNMGAALNVQARGQYGSCAGLVVVALSSNSCCGDLAAADGWSVHYRALGHSLLQLIAC